MYGWTSKYILKVRSSVSYIVYVIYFYVFICWQVLFICVFICWQVLFIYVFICCQVLFICVFICWKVLFICVFICWLVLFICVFICWQVLFICVFICWQVLFIYVFICWQVLFICVFICWLVFIRNNSNSPLIENEWWILMKTHVIYRELMCPSFTIHMKDEVISGCFTIWKFTGEMFHCFLLAIWRLCFCWSWEQFIFKNISGIGSIYTPYNLASQEPKPL